MKVVKVEGEKFKDSLRNIIVQFVLQNSVQEDHLAFSKKWKEDKLGLTLTNQLLFKLEEVFKDTLRQKNELEGKVVAVQRELGTIREETIFRTNQTQNSESQLRNKIALLSEDL